MLSQISFLGYSIRSCVAFIAKYSFNGDLHRISREWNSTPTNMRSLSVTGAEVAAATVESSRNIRKEELTELFAICR